MAEIDQSLKNIREKIERGFQQSERGELVSGKEVLAELRLMSEERRRLQSRRPQREDSRFNPDGAP